MIQYYQRFVKKYDDTEKLISAPPLPTKSRIVVFLSFFKYKILTKKHRKTGLYSSFYTKTLFFPVLFF